MATPSKTRSQILNGWGTADSGPINPQETIFSANIRALIESTKWVDEGIDSISTNAENDILTVTYSNGSIQTIALSKYVETVTIDDGVLTFRDVSGNVLAQSPKFATASQLEAEAAIRESADETLQSNLDSEALTRQNIDTQLQTNIDIEKNARIDQDTAIRTDLSKEVADREAADDILQANILREETEREAADNDLHSELNEEKLARQNGDNAEAASRSQADVILQTNIDSEESERISEDAAIRLDLAAEETARTAGDDNLQNQIDTFQTDLDAEEAARIAGDAALQSELERVEADLTTETSDRVAGDETLQNGIDTINSTLSSYSDRLDKIEAKTQAIVFSFDETEDYSVDFDEVSFILKPNGGAIGGNPTWEMFVRNDTEENLGVGFAGYYEYSSAGAQRKSVYEVLASGAETVSFDADNAGLGYGTANSLGTINFNVSTSLGSVFRVLVTCPSFLTSGDKNVTFTVQRISDVIVS
ncbi:hypothetical protein IW492_05880 [Enterococcus sp. BWB1-3]|uniref:hypothetical protein n=1 Tax=Enterococcus sp. BWB1-3 TaxID=2787713 RepID=UPI0019225660|nr:hypothetical protein [Enterococcus sp. BWB1-3]MBL1228761.1 hypothetical protein [Enterococcus sp. BWB1-3]